MPRLASFAVLLLLCGGLGSVSTEVGSLRGFLYGSEPACSYDNWVSHISEGQVSGLNVYAPWETQNNDFGEYHIPTQAELGLWSLVVDDFLAQDLAGAQMKIRNYGFPYQVVNFQDLDSGRNLFMLREFLNDDIDDNGTDDPADDETGSFDYGWGLYVFNPWASRQLVITAPHPCDDYPSPVFALEAFYKLDARFLLISGAGREVAYIPPYYSNNQSISDPSRCAAHPLNEFYQQACDQLRGLTGRTEFSLQIHSFDWNKYSGHPNVMLSAGNGRRWPALPIRDNSRARHDLINHTPWLVHQQNSLGTHSEVDILDFYCVYQYPTDPVTYLHDSVNVDLPFNTELPGAEFNQQMLYTTQQNVYDVYSPFLHVEMDELPKCYARTPANWNWFFGYDTETQAWIPDQRYTRFTQFFLPWLNALEAVIDSMLVLDDGTGPSNPENLRVTSLFSQEAEIAWDRSYSYDFDSYVLHLRWEEQGIWHSQVLDRHTNSELAWQNQDSYILDLDVEPRVYYLSVQARDKHGNHSLRSNEIKIFKLGSPITEFSATAGNGAVDLYFAAGSDSALGFNIHRAAGNAAPELLSSWIWDPDLQPDPGGNYTFLDTNLANGTIYHYQVSAEYPGGQENYFWQTLSASPNPLWSLTLNDIDHQLSKNFQFGTNPLASDGWDQLDQYESATGGQLKIGSFLPEADDSVVFIRDIRSWIDPNNTNKRWDLRCRSQNTGVYLYLSAGAELLASGHDILIYDVQRDRWHDLREGPYSWWNTQTGWQDLQLHWGKQLPRVQFTPAPDLFAWQGDTLNLHYVVVNLPRVESVDLWLCTGQDSLEIATGLPPQITDWPYTALQELSGAQLLVLAQLAEGGSLHRYSRQRFNVLPQNISYQQDPGYSLLSFPHSGFGPPVSEFLGNSASAWILDSLWIPQSTLNNQQGFLIRHPQAFQATLPVETPAWPLTLNLHPGWNLLPNPHYYHYELKDLRFTHGQSQKSYSQLVAEGLLPPRVILYDDAGFRLARSIPPGQAALVHYQDTLPLSVVFDPCYHDGEAFNWTEQWSVSLSLSDGYNSGEAVQAGTADLSSEGLDTLFDLPKPPPFPDMPYRLALRLADPQTGETHLLQCEYRGLYPFYNQSEKTWQLQLELADQRPLRFRLDTSSLPESYSAELSLFGQAWELHDGQPLWCDPPSAGTHLGQISIRSYTPTKPHSSKSEGISVYPNPFRAELRIQLSSIKAEEISLAVYNLRGQKVCELKRGKLSQDHTDLIWDGRDGRGEDLPAGIYLLRISSEQGIQTHKLVKY
ncbi:MAG: T9SS type A sorting domain-containing protein [Candidatus Cloacimonetes bacterium]|nr:T9SS type A sorting domain-containing protein [Candidatus Cloacimonadota bacterium]